MRLFGVDVDLSKEKDRFAFSFVIVMLGGVLLNSITLVVMVAKRKYRKTYHAAYINLAVSDLFLCLFGAMFRGQGYLGVLPNGATCEVGIYLSLALPSINFLAVLPITLDRTIAVFQPYQYSTKMHHVKQHVVTAVSWALPVAMSLVQLAYQHLSGHTSCSVFMPEGRTSCRVASWLRTTIFYHFPTAVCGVFTLVVCTAAYIAICYKLRTARHWCPRNTNILIRSILLCLIFAVSFLPAFITVDILQRDVNCNHAICARTLMYLNTLTDPILYVFSNGAARLCAGNRKTRASRKSLVISGICAERRGTFDGRATSPRGSRER